MWRRKTRGKMGSEGIGSIIPSVVVIDVIPTSTAAATVTSKRRAAEGTTGMGGLGLGCFDILAVQGRWSGLDAAEEH